MGEIFTLGDLEKLAEEKESRIDKAEERTEDFEELHGNIRKKPHDPGGNKRFDTDPRSDLREKHINEFHEKEIQESLNPTIPENGSAEGQEELSPELTAQLINYYRETKGNISFDQWSNSEKKEPLPNNGNNPKKLKREEIAARKEKNFSITGGRHSIRV
jgi:hypothetical protein